jgi:hypothetical protein
MELLVDERLKETVPTNITPILLFPCFIVNNPSTPSWSSVNWYVPDARSSEPQRVWEGSVTLPERRGDSALSEVAAKHIAAMLTSRRILRLDFMM